MSKTKVSLCMLTIMLVWSARLNRVVGNRKVPYFFNFGDSLTSNGNNNKFLLSVAKADYLPYGIDFKGGVPGRFTNGRTYIDVLCELLGFTDYIPPFKLKEVHPDIPGINYASAGAGILVETGRNLGRVIPFREQLQYHEKAIAKLERAGNSSIPKLLRKSIYLIGMGNNDYLNNYFMNFTLTNKYFTPTKFANRLIRDYKRYVQRLYNLGGRKMVVVSTLLSGCIPAVVKVFAPPPKGSDCNEIYNGVIDLFNKRLFTLVQELNRNRTFKDAHFIYINGTEMQRSIVRDVGFKFKIETCCIPLFAGRCIPFSKPCSNRKEYVFWDLYHPTERVHVMFAKRAYKAQNHYDAYPMDISRLIKL